MSDTSIDAHRLAVKQAIVEIFRLRMDPTTIGDDDPLFGDALGLDSVDAIDLVQAMDKRWGVVVEDEESSRDAFASVATLTDFVLANGGKPAG